ncbi:Response regulator rcp1 [Candidatus Sulfotelmatobacter kueseliae]|jgi:two-component system, chemotaxis family, response regulator Rcp1|uniref:Response regulator rcp1 n=1 Tax=Candidatus Sulfotelmatobacter kueseliae TaxID=2042962 RepID=A0A2U3K8B5_9BACT|nr:Response regulator rcp1 [Candidatus Sulfotelmatobacter kueseliae]
MEKETTLMKDAPDILLVDDNPADVGLTREVLAASTHHSNIHNVPDGEEAIAFLRRRGKYTEAIRPDLVVLDLNMPRKGGQAVLAEVKTDPGLRTIPIVVFTTSHAEKDITHSYELGANCYISKPGNLGDFFSAVQSIEEFWFGFTSLPH